MDTDSPVFKLQVITLLDSTCYGLIYGFLSPYIVTLGANQFIVAVLGVGNLLCNLLSAHIINSFAKMHGKIHSLYMIFNAAMVLHLMLILTNCYWFTIFSRYIFSLTNQSQNLCKELLLQNAPEDKRECCLKKYSILNGSGFIIGPFVAGWLFDVGFGYICLLATALTFMNTLLIMSIFERRESLPERDELTVVEKTQDDICDVIQDIKMAECESNWDLLAMKFLFLSSVAIFSSKFTQILKHNFRSSHFVIGYTISYMNGLNYIAVCFTDSLRNKSLSDISILKSIEYGLMLSGTLLLIACYSPAYCIYAFICVPIFFCFSFMDSSWKDLFFTRDNSALEEISKHIKTAVGLTVPLLFGLLHNVIGHHAAIFFSTVPVFAALYILKMHTCTLYTD